MHRLVVDANIMVSAILGASFPRLVEIFQAGVQLVSPVQQLAETRAVLCRRLTDEEVVDMRMADLMTVIEPVEVLRFGSAEQTARARLDRRGQPDWPVLATALAIGAEIWSNDRDFFGVGVPIWSSRNVHMIGAAA